MSRGAHIESIAPMLSILMKENERFEIKFKRVFSYWEKGMEVKRNLRKQNFQRQQG